MSSTINTIFQQTGTIKNTRVAIGSLTPVTNTVSGDECVVKEYGVGTSATVVAYDASAASEPVAAFSQLTIVPNGGDVIVKLSVDQNSSNGGVKTMYMKVPDGKPFMLFSNYSKSADDTADVIDKIEFINPSGSVAITVMAYWAG